MLNPLGFLHGATAVSIGLSESVQLELVKTAGVVVASLTSSFAAWLAYKNRNTVKNVERKVERKRRAVRDADNEQVLVLEDQRSESPPHFRRKP